MYIANIVTKSKMNCGVFFNTTSNIGLIDNSLPTLIIGWELVKELYPNQNILDNKINENITWTFSKREKRYQYEKDIETFNKMVLSNLNKMVNYHFFNYLTANNDKRKCFIDYINKGNCSLYYNSRFLYIYNGNDSITIGISLNDIKYIGLNILDFIKTLNINNNNIICDNFDFNDENTLFFIKDNVKSVAFLNYLKNKDIYKKIVFKNDKANY